MRKIERQRPQGLDIAPLGGGSGNKMASGNTICPQWAVHPPAGAPAPGLTACER